MTNKELFIAEVDELCKTCDIAIDQIAKDCGLTSDIVAMIFIQAFMTVLNERRGNK